MSKRHLIIKGGIVVNSGKRSELDILCEDNIITRVEKNIELKNSQIIDAKGKFVIPGIIDDQVHFREPGLTQKGDIESESKSAVLGGITSFMEMPNTIPQTISFEELNNKNSIAEKKSWTNYAFYLGATNNNIEVIKNINIKEICGVKLFMGSSTGNMLVDNQEKLLEIFKESKVPVAVHSEDESTIQMDLKRYKEKFGNSASPEIHKDVRSREACIKSTKRAIEICKLQNGHLHLLHLSTKEEVELIRQAKEDGINVTAEVCVHHLWFDSEDYSKKGNFIKWNPSIKLNSDKLALREGLKNGTIDIVATDHAPHEKREKNRAYFEAPSGGPMVQHSLLIMLKLVEMGVFKFEDVISWMCHKPAKLFEIKKRGFINNGYFADIVIVDPNDKWTVDKKNINYKCGWSPLEGEQFNQKVVTTIINGNVIYDNGKFLGRGNPLKLEFER